MRLFYLITFYEGSSCFEQHTINTVPTNNVRIRQIYVNENAKIEARTKTDSV